jgi:hypothetical protein
MKPAQNDHKLQEALKSLDRSGAVRYIFNIRRRAPGQHTFPFWRRNIPVDEVPDIAELCYGDGGGEYEYRIEVRGGDGKPVGIEDAILPPISQPAPPVPVAADPMSEMLVHRQRELAMQRQELIMQQQEASLAKERKRLEKLRDGGGEEEEEEEAPFNPYANPYGMSPYGMSPYGMPQPGMPWWMQQQGQQQQNKQSDMVELAKAFASMGQPKQQDSSLELLKVLLPLLAGGNKGMDPKDMLSMFSPFVLEMSKASSEANKIVMNSLAESDSAFREKMLDMIMADPSRTPDEIEKWKGWMRLGTEAIKETVRVVVGRDTIMAPGKPKATVEVPKIAGAPAGLPAPAANPAPASDPKANALEIVKARVVSFVAAIEQEAMVGSDAGAVVDQVDQLFLFLPKKLREKIFASRVAEIFDALREYAPAEVERLMNGVREDATGELREWYEVFWEVLKTPPEDDEEGDDGPDEEGESEPAPEGPQEKVEA